MLANISAGWNKLGLQTRLQILIQGFLLVVLICAQQWILKNFEGQILKTAQERAAGVADGAINGLNTLMLIKAGDDDVISDKKNRELFIQKIGTSEGVKELRIVRSKQLEEEFEPGLPQEEPVDDMDRKVLATGKVEYKMILGQNGEASLRTVMPFIAKKNFRSINCLECHGVDEGATIGAASVVVDVKEDMAAIRTINIWMWIGLGVLQVLLFFVIGAIVKRLLRQLGGEPAYVIDIVRQIAKGNLVQEIATRSNDNSSLLSAMKQMQVGLREIIGGALETAEMVAQAARQLAESSHEVLAASERQSDASASVAASVEEMTVCVGQITENAADAQKYASEAGELAKDGSGVVQSVIAEMDKISEAVTTSSAVITSLGEQSHKISNIVNVIKEIADQTNLLALNAAIEAARAGEQGRGFAVVADEVRKLAERTTHSTQEIASMIEAIQSGTNDAVAGMATGDARVGEGVQMVGRAGQSMKKIQSGVQKVLASVDDISTSLKEQSTTSSLIAKNIEGIAQMTEETRAVIQQVSTSADNLEHLATKLKESVDLFKL